MQTQQSRDEKTVAIATGLGLFCLVLAVGGLLLWGVDALLDLSEPSLTAFLGALLVTAGVALVVSVSRAGKE